MSTDIRPTPDHDNWVTLRGMGSTVDLFAMTGAETVTWRTVPHADFIRAIESECDVTVIDNATLPHLDPEAFGYSGYVYRDGRTIALLTAEQHRERAAEELALARYIDAHPPVDEAQVEALADLIMTKRREVDGRPLLDQYRDLARAFLATGRIEVKP